MELKATKIAKLFSKCKDSVKDDDLTYLTAEEEKAIDDYKKAISNTSDPKMLRIFSHILKEETDHLEELQNENVEDSYTKDAVTYLTKEQLNNIERDISSVKGKYISMAFRYDYDDDNNKGYYIKELYINTTGTWLYSVEEGNRYKQELDNAIKILNKYKNYIK